MKNSITVLFLSFVISILIIFPGRTQITITSGDLFSFVGTQKIMETDSSGSLTVDVGSPGANQSWNFTQTIVQANIETWDFLDPANTPYAANFPTSNIALRISSTTFSDTIYSFFRIENSAFTEVGQVLFFQDTTIIQQKSLLVLPLPCTMGANWMTRDSSEFGFAGNRIVEIDVQENTVDGWGTVNVPSGQFNCLRIREDNVFISNIYVNDILILSDTTRSINYTWITKEVIVAAQAESQANDTNPNFTNASNFTRNIPGTTSIVEPSGYGSDKFVLYANYPNPFNATTEITFDLPQNSFINLSVYNITGQKVAELVNRQMAYGTHRISWNAGQLPSGLYFYRLQAGNNRLMRKMILMK